MFLAYLHMLIHLYTNQVLCSVSVLPAWPLFLALLYIESDSVCDASNIVLQVGKPFDLVVLAVLLSGLIKTSMLCHSSRIGTPKPFVAVITAAAILERSMVRMHS